MGRPSPSNLSGMALAIGCENLFRLKRRNKKPQHPTRRFPTANGTIRSLLQSNDAKRLFLTGTKVDRIACPWLIRRFVDPNDVFLFVAPAEVTAVTEPQQARADKRAVNGRA